jgi:membrane-associated phospholipid phosphatase
MKYLKPFLFIALGIAIVAVSIRYLDEPAATWSHEHLHRPPIFNRFARYADPLPVVAALGLAGIGLAAAFGHWKSTSFGRTLVAGCIAVLVGESIKEQLKYFFGRPWPEGWPSDNPTWIGTHSAAFQYFHGGTGWESFPSGHTAQMAAIATVVWIRLPRVRWLGVATATLVAFALWFANYHFIGDILAGAFLGIACGKGVVAVVCAPRPVFLKPAAATPSAAAAGGRPPTRGKTVARQTRA